MDRTAGDAQRKLSSRSRYPGRQAPKQIVAVKQIVSQIRRNPLMDRRFMDRIERGIRMFTWKKYPHQIVPRASYQVRRKLLKENQT